VSGEWLTAGEVAAAVPGVDVEDLPVLAATGAVRQRAEPVWGERGRFAGAVVQYSLDDALAYAAQLAVGLLNTE
jgi:hypothetical protein